MSDPEHQANDAPAASDVAAPQPLPMHAEADAARKGRRVLLLAALLVGVPGLIIVVLTLTSLEATDLQALQGRGLVVPDPLRLGIESTPAGDVFGADGQVVDGLLAVGPPRKGTLWESTAIPEIRTQAAEVARAVLARTTA